MPIAMMMMMMVINQDWPGLPTHVHLLFWSHRYNIGDWSPLNVWWEERSPSTITIIAEWWKLSTMRRVHVLSSSLTLFLTSLLLVCFSQLAVVSRTIYCARRSSAQLWFSDDSSQFYFVAFYFIHTVYSLFIVSIIISDVFNQIVFIYIFNWCTIKNDNNTDNNQESIGITFFFYLLLLYCYLQPSLWARVHSCKHTLPILPSFFSLGVSSTFHSVPCDRTQLKNPSMVEVKLN